MAKEITDKKWAEFVKWCKLEYPVWTPDRETIIMFLEWERVS